jgi:hypothetical protein
MPLGADPGGKIARRPADPGEPPPLGRQGPATFLALIGVLWFLVCIEVARP